MRSVPWHFLANCLACFRAEDEQRVGDTDGSTANLRSPIHAQELNSKLLVCYPEFKSFFDDLGDSRDSRSYSTFMPSCNRVTIGTIKP
eukprot:s271_g44.t1